MRLAVTPPPKGPLRHLLILGGGQIGLNWSQIGPDWSQEAQTGSDIAQEPQIGPDTAQEAQIGPDWSQEAQIGPDTAQEAQIGPEYAPERCFGRLRCQIFVEIDVLGARMCTGTVFWALEVPDLR